MEINPHIFRGYDIRGLVDKDLNPEIVELLGRAYGTFLLKRGIKKAIVGQDCRITSPAYSKAIIKGILSTGVDVIDIGLALAGNVYWAQYHFDAQGCVSVSASHNPREYNGFKMGKGFSETLLSEDVQEIRRLVQEGSFLRGAGKLEKKDIKEAYLKDLIGRFPGKFEGFKVVVDPSNATPGFFVPDLLRMAGCQVICSNCELDGNFPLGTPDPTSAEVAGRLAKRVLEEKANLGLSYDSDGDRIGVVDDKGNILWNDILVALFAKDCLEQNSGAKIVFNSLCSRVVEDIIREKGGKAIMWRTGHSFIKAKAQKEKALFAGELSGHFYFLDKFYPHDDGCYSTLRLLNYLVRARKTLSEAVGELPRYISSPEIKVFCADEEKEDLMQKIGIVLRRDFAEAEIIDDERVGDGVRLNLPDSMFGIRYSQNGPYLTIKFEAKTEEKYASLKKYIKNLLFDYEEIDWSSKVNVNIESLN
ncbi:MAG: phosphomannomutase/phosphoglucomutase [bacterium]|nr:phosphomannomutase/phosphoglucomutase [bacterium]